MQRWSTPTVGRAVAAFIVAPRVRQSTAHRTMPAARGVLRGVLLLLLLLLRAPLGLAVTLVVDDLADSNDGVCEPGTTGGSCNIRAGVDYCLDAGVSTLVDTCVLQLVNGTHYVTQGSIQIDSAVVAISIEGEGPGETVVFGGLNNGRWLDVEGAFVQFALSSLTVQAFAASGIFDGSGGALYLKSTHNATFRSVEFLQNSALEDGGAAFCESSPGLTFAACAWQDNSAGESGGALILSQSDGALFSDVLWQRNNAADHGGGLYLDRSKSATLFNCSWQGNEASNEGGGLYLSQSANGAFHNCTWSANFGGEGGGVYSVLSSDAACSDCLWGSNRASHDGGGLYMDLSDRWTFSGCTWRNNTANGDGGGIYIDSSHRATFLDATWVANKAVVAGAISMSVSQGCTYMNCSWQGNVADGAAALDLFTSTSTTFSFCEWHDNAAVNGDGGALVLSLCQDNVFYNCLYNNNTAKGAGGSMWMYSSADVTFHGCSWLNGSSPAGAGLYLTQNSRHFILSNCSFANLVAENGAGVYLDGGNINIRLADCIAHDNLATSDGGVIYARSDNSAVQLVGCSMWNNSANRGAVIASTLATTASWIDSCTFQRNRALYGAALYLGSADQWLVSNTEMHSNEALVQAGAVLIVDSEVVVITDTVLRDNSAKTSTGGAVDVSGGATLVFADSAVVGNTARSQGGGICVDSASVYVTNSSVQGNEAQGDGGGLYAEGSALLQLGRVPPSLLASLQGLFLNMTLNITQGRVIIQDNLATSSGGGVYVSEGTLLLPGALVRENTALESGGGLGLGSEAFVLDVNSTISGNAANAGAGLFVEDGARVSFRATTIAQNNASQSGAGIYLRSGTYTFANVSLTSNRAQAGGGGGIFWDWTSVLGYVDTSNISFVDNEALYGPDVATAIRNVSAPATAFASSGDSVPSLDVAAVDAYNQTVVTYGSNYAQASAAAGADSRCSNPKLSGSSVADFTAGVATFEALAVTCDPGSVALVSFTVVDTDLSASFEATTRVRLGACELGEIVVSQQCELCGAGEYAWNTSLPDCKECLAHSTCPETSGWHVDVNPGYWRDGVFSTRVRWCPASDACQGGANASDAQCAEGSSGPLCLVCGPNYYQPSNLSKCEPCDSGSRWAPILVIVSLLLCVIAAGVWIYYRKQEWVEAFQTVYSRVSFRVYWKVLLAYVQIVTQFREIFSVSYPSSYTATSSALNVANLGFSTIVAPHCYDSGYDFYDTLVIQTVGALGLVLLGAVYYAVRHVLCKSTEERQQLWSDAFGWFIFFAYLVFPGTSTTIFQAFPCDDDFDGNGSYLKADYSVSCRSLRYRAFVVYASVMVIIFPVGILALYAYVLWMHRTRICPSTETVSESQQTAKINQLHETIKEQEALLPSVSHKNTKSSYEAALAAARRHLRFEMRSQDQSLLAIAFLFEAYRPELWWMELVECLRRLLMSSVLVFFWPATSTQIIAAMVICVFFLLLYTWSQPHMHESSNSLMSAVLWCVLSQLFLSLLLFEDLIGSDALAGILLVLAMVVGPIVPLLTTAWSQRSRVFHPGASSRSGGIAMHVVKTALGVRESESLTHAQNDDNDAVTKNPLRENMEL